jgi:hypothetical protein
MITADFQPELPVSVATVVPVLLVAFSYGIASSALSYWWNRWVPPVSPSLTSTGRLAERLIDLLDKGRKAEALLTFIPAMSRPFAHQLGNLDLESLIPDDLRSQGLVPLNGDEVSQLATLREMASAGKPRSDLLAVAQSLVRPRYVPAMRSVIYRYFLRWTVIVPGIYLVMALTDESFAFVALLERNNSFHISMVVLTLVIMALTGLSILIRIYVSDIAPSP